MKIRNKLFMSVGIPIILILIGIVIAGCSQPTGENAGPVDKEKINLGVEDSLLTGTVWVAESKGYFEMEGLDLDIKEFDSGRLSFQAMLKGEGVDISTVAPTPIMFSSFDRQDFYIFSTFVYANEDIKVIADRSEGITTVTDLKGKKIGTPIGTTGQFVTEVFLLNNGILPSEVEIIDISPSDLPDALKNKQVDVIVIWEPHAYNAQNLLGQDAIRLSGSELYRTTFNFLVMKDYAESHPEVLVKFIRAIDNATDFIGENKEESKTIVAERLKLDEENMTKFWDAFTFEISLDQSFLVAIEAEARWAIDNKLTDKIEVPNYLDYIYYDALEEVKPEAIGIIH